MANRTYHQRGRTVHGFAVREHPLYATWADMLARCYNRENKAFKNYGARGILVDPHWHHFENFAIDMGLKPDAALTLERRDNNAGYRRDNCQWGTRTEQCLNRRTFRNNTTGARGVVAVGGNRYTARFDYERQRYDLGRFSSVEAASAAREAFIGLFFVDRSAALAMLEEESTWCTSSTGVRGVTRHADGGFIARTTINKQRVYLGYFRTVEEASAAIQAARGKS